MNKVEVLVDGIACRKLNKWINQLNPDPGRGPCNDCPKAPGCMGKFSKGGKKYAEEKQNNVETEKIGYGYVPGRLPNKLDPGKDGAQS